MASLPHGGGIAVIQSFGDMSKIDYSCACARKHRNMVQTRGCAYNVDRGQYLMACTGTASILPYPVDMGLCNVLFCGHGILIAVRRRHLEVSYDIIIWFWDHGTKAGAVHWSHRLPI